MIGRRLVAGLIAGAVGLSACGAPPEPPAGGNVSITPIGGGSVGLSDVALLAPVQAGESLYVLNGYNDPNPGDPCPTPGLGLDHCNNQRYGLDLVPSNLADPAVLAPLSGSVEWTGNGCLGIKTRDNLNLTICHFATILKAAPPPYSVKRGDLLGLRDPGKPWIHLSLDARYAADGSSLPTPPPSYPAVAFSGAHAIEGLSFADNEPTPVQDHQCETIVSTNTLPAGTTPPPLLASATSIWSNPCSTAETASSALPSPALDLSPAPSEPNSATLASPTVAPPQSAPTITPFVTPTSASGPNGITAGSDGALWFTETYANAIGRITTTGTIREYPLPTANGAPVGIVEGPDGALWFTESGRDQVGRLTKKGIFTEYPFPAGSGNVSPGPITAGPDGALWFSEQNANAIGRVTTEGRITSFALPNDSSTPWGITAGPDGALWFVEIDGNRIGRLSTSGRLTEYAIPTARARPNGITVGPDGALWFTELNGSAIGRITTSGQIAEYPTYSGGGPNSIVTGPDGALWFTEQYTGMIGRISTAGEVVEFHGPVAGHGYSEICVGPDHNLWFTTFGGSPSDSVDRVNIAP